MKNYISIFLPVFLFIFSAFATSSYAEHTKPQLGTYLGELDDGLREMTGYQGKGGVLVHGIIKGSGAEKSGLERNDIILECNGQKIGSVEDLVKVVKQTTPGDRIPIKFFRKGLIKTTSVEITEKKDWIEYAPPQKWIYFKSNRPYLGIRIHNLNPQLAEYFKVQSGLLITEIAENSPAHLADLRAGDVIIAWQDKEVDSKSSFYNHLNQSKEGDRVEFKIIRHGEKLEKAVILGKVRDRKTYGFHIHRNDSGELVFRMGDREYPARLDIPLPDFDLDLKELRDMVKSLQEGVGSYREEMENLKDEVHELKKEIETLKEKKNI